MKGSLLSDGGTFTPAEAAALTGCPERRIRKELEHQVIRVSGLPRLPFAALLYVRWLHVTGEGLGVGLRAEVCRGIFRATEEGQRPKRIPVARYLTVELGPVLEEMDRKVSAFNRWKQRLATDPGIMGGEAVFPGSRLTVRHVGGMLERGESPDVILEDYPYLSREDLEFARTYVRAYPRVGRPPQRQATG